MEGRQQLELETDNPLAQDIHSFFNASRENAELFQLNRIFQYLTGSEVINHMNLAEKFTHDQNLLTDSVAAVIEQNDPALWPMKNDNIEKVLSSVLPRLGDALDTIYSEVRNLEQNDPDSWQKITEYVYAQNEEDDNDMINQAQLGDLKGFGALVCKAYIFAIAKGLANPEKFPNPDRSGMSSLNPDVRDIMALLTEVSVDENCQQKLLDSKQSKEQFDPSPDILGILKANNSKTLKLIDTNSAVKQASEGRAPLRRQKSSLTRRASQLFSSHAVTSPKSNENISETKEAEKKKRESLMRRVSSKNLSQNKVKHAEKTEHKSEQKAEKKEEKSIFRKFGF